MGVGYEKWLWAYKIGNISETVEDRAKVTINCLYKVVHGLSNAVRVYLLLAANSNLDLILYRCRDPAA